MEAAEPSNKHKLKEEQIMEQHVKQVQLERMMTAQQVADLLHVSAKSVWRWSKSGKLKSYKLGDAGIWRYWPDDVAHFMEQQNSVKL